MRGVAPCLPGFTRLESALPRWAATIEPGAVQCARDCRRGGIFDERGPPAGRCVSGDVSGDSHALRCLPARVDGRRIPSGELICAVLCSARGLSRDRRRSPDICSHGKDEWAVRVAAAGRPVRVDSHTVRCLPVGVDSHTARCLPACADRRRATHDELIRPDLHCESGCSRSDRRRADICSHRKDNSAVRVAAAHRSGSACTEFRYVVSSSTGVFANERWTASDAGRLRLPATSRQRSACMRVMRLQGASRTVKP